VEALAHPPLRERMERCARVRALAFGDYLIKCLALSTITGGTMRRKLCGRGRWLFWPGPGPSGHSQYRLPVGSGAVSNLQE
jgi:hypothetical protein